MTTTYRAFYPGVEDSLVMDASTKRFPIRESAHLAAKDARDHWHKEGEHIVPYRIEGASVVQLEARVHRVVEVN